MHVKICGITSVGDAELALKSGADAVGLNMVAGPRRVTADVAGEILSTISVAGKAVRQPCSVLLAKITAGRLDDDVEEVVAAHQVRWIQLYGDVTPSVIGSQNRAGRSPVPVIRVADEGFAADFSTFLAECGDDKPPAVVMDAYHRDKLGGTGEPFRWSWVVAARERGELDGWPPIVLAGGLNPGNISRAVQVIRPWAVDVSSGVEASPGRKDPIKLRDFIAQAQAGLGQGDG